MLLAIINPEKEQKINQAFIRLFSFLQIPYEKLILKKFNLTI
jgi:hypothetical protein